MKTSYTAPLIKSLGEAGYGTTYWGHQRIVFSDRRDGGIRRIKLWFADDVFRSRRAKQVKLEAALKANYGEAYIGGKFITRAIHAAQGGKSLVITIKDDKSLFSTGAVESKPKFKAGDWVALVNPENLTNQNRIARLIRPRPAGWDMTPYFNGPRWEVDRPFATGYGVTVRSLPECNIKLIETSSEMERYVLSHAHK